MSFQTPGADPGQRREAVHTCADCGTPATPGHSFCDGCGAVLRWSGSGSGAAAAPAPNSGPADRGSATGRDTGAAASGAPAPDQAVPDQAAASYRTPPDQTAAPYRTPPDQTAAPYRTPPDQTAASYQTPPDQAAPYRTPPDQTAAPYRTPPDHVTVSFPAVPEQAAAWSRTAPDQAAPTGPGMGPEPLSSATDRARALLIPVADPEQRTPVIPSVAPVLPGVPVAARPVVRTPGAEPDGGTPCPWCGTGNWPDRHFCRRCAMPMTRHPEVSARRPWWRRLGSGNQEVPWAGDRPRLRGGFGRILSWTAGAAALALLIAAAFQVGPATTAVVDHFAKRAPVAPDSVLASRSWAGHGAALVFDKTSNTWWGPGISESGEGQWIEARFQQPTRLLDVVITPGVSTQAAALSKSALPHRVEARITTSDGHVITRFLTLDQGSGPQTRAFRVGPVSSVRFILRSAYFAAANKQVAIAEIEFFGRSNADSS